MVGSSVGAIAFCVLQSTGAVYRGLSDVEGAFPGRMQRLPEGIDWTAQCERWTQQVDELVAELSRGDGRILLTEWESAAGPFASLSRVYAEMHASREQEVARE